MRQLVQPGPIHPSRIDSFAGEPIACTFDLRPGQTLIDALTAPLALAGFQGATLTFAGAELNPFRYVMPGPPDDATHVAYFTAPHAPAGAVRIELANATFGWAAGKPFLHCHAVWTESDGTRRGGHILPQETVLAAPAQAHAWGFHNIRIEAAPDAETNFTLFQPGGASTEGARGIVARVRPNQDITTAIETIARVHGIADAVIRGSLGSLIGARFTDGTAISDIATEVLVRRGVLRNGIAELDLLVVDMEGRVHEGWLERGENPVCITFDVVLEAVSVA
ncbi:MAG TPA: hypothetical protein VIG49_06645 [Acetobacteraceae bacterium]